MSSSSGEARNAEWILVLPVQFKFITVIRLGVCQGLCTQVGAWGWTASRICQGWLGYSGTQPWEDGTAAAVSLAQ